MVFGLTAATSSTNWFCRPGKPEERNAASPHKYYGGLGALGGGNGGFMICSTLLGCIPVQPDLLLCKRHLAEQLVDTSVGRNDWHVLCSRDL
jgi:hypothetical protein